MSETEHDITQFDVPTDAEYGGHPIEEIGYNHDLDRVYVLYEDENGPDGWEQLIFGAEKQGGQARVTNFPPGLVTPEMLPEDGDTPGGRESKALYELLEEVGVEVARFDE